MSIKIACNVNGRDYGLEIDEKESLLELLRDRLELTGTKQGCSVGECGACAVLVDGTTVDSCIYLAAWVDEKKVITIEGIAKEDGSLSDVQESFIESGAVQCGFCTPGLVLSTTAFLEQNKNPSREDIRRGISGNLCRCTGYQKIVEAVERTVEKRKVAK